MNCEHRSFKILVFSATPVSQFERWGDVIEFCEENHTEFQAIIQGYVDSSTESIRQGIENETERNTLLNQAYEGFSNDIEVKFKISIDAIGYVQDSVNPLTDEAETNIIVVWKNNPLLPDSFEGNFGVAY